MLLAVARNWWVLLLRGILAILLGLMAFAWPGMTLFALVILYGAYAFVDGLAAIAFGVSGRREQQQPGPEPSRAWWEMVVVGVLGVAAGIVTFVWPGITALALLVIIAVSAIVRGVAEIMAAVRLRKIIDHEWLLVLGGVLQAAFGVVLLLRPAAGALAMMWLIGAWALVFGVVAIALSLRLRNIKNRLEGPGGTAPAVGVA